MKRILIILDDAPHATLKKMKDESGMGWDRYILYLARLDKEGNKLD